MNAAELFARLPSLPPDGYSIQRIKLYHYD